MYAPSATSTATGPRRAVPSTGGARSNGQPQTRLRITRRGRAALTGLLAVPVVAGALLFAVNGGGAMADSSQAQAVGAFDYVTVHAGQSLWELAETVAPAADPRDVISEIMTLNQLDTVTVLPGQLLAIPLVYSS